MAKFNQNKTIIAIEAKSIFKIILLLATAFVFVKIWSIVLVILAALIFSWGLDPLVYRLSLKKIPRIFSLITIYICLFTFIALTFVLIIPPISNESTELAKNFPSYIEGIKPIYNNLLNQYPWLNQLPNGFSNLGNAAQMSLGGLMDIIGGLFGNILTFLLVAVLTFYMVAEENSLKNLIVKLAPREKEKRILNVLEQVKMKMGNWLVGQIFLCFIIFLFTYIGLSILGVKYALILSIIAGILEAVPYLGPIMSAVPATIIAFIQAPLLTPFVLVMYLVIQQLENNILVPMVMRQAVGINPILSIIVLLVGYELGGILGAVLAIPLCTAILVIIEDWSKYQTKEKNYEKNIPKSKARARKILPR